MVQLPCSQTKRQLKTRLTYAYTRARDPAKTEIGINCVCPVMLHVKRIKRNCRTCFDRKPTLDNPSVLGDPRRDDSEDLANFCFYQRAMCEPPEQESESCLYRAVKTRRITGNGPQGADSTVRYDSFISSNEADKPFTNPPHQQAAPRPHLS